MLSTCPYCGRNVRTHETCCRVPTDLDRFERVYERLAAERRDDFLQDNLMRYLVAFGRRDIETAWQG